MNKSDARWEILQTVNLWLLERTLARRERLRVTTLGRGNQARLMRTLAALGSPLLGMRHIQRAVHISRRHGLIPNPVLKIAGFQGGNQ